MVDPPDNLTPQTNENPATEQGFLMPEQTDQQNFAPENSQLGDSAMATDEQLLPSIEGFTNDSGN